MFNLAMQLLASASALVTQTGAVLQYAGNLPPMPSQATISCRDESWQQANLTALGGSYLEKRLATYASKALADANLLGLGLGITVAYRSCDYQLQLRAQNCGLGDYNLYQRPSNECFPPTEPAGKSLHNEGLAIDFFCSGYPYFETSPCFSWLQKNGANYRLLNHPFEAWHWSTTGK